MKTSKHCELAEMIYYNPYITYPAEEEGHQRSMTAAIEYNPILETIPEESETTTTNCDKNQTTNVDSNRGDNVNLLVKSLSCFTISSNSDYMNNKIENISNMKRSCSLNIKENYNMKRSCSLSIVNMNQFNIEQIKTISTKLKDLFQKRTKRLVKPVLTDKIESKNVVEEEKFVKKMRKSPDKPARTSKDSSASDSDIEDSLLIKALLDYEQNKNISIE